METWVEAGEKWSSTSRSVGDTGNAIREMWPWNSERMEAAGMKGDASEKPAAAGGGGRIFQRLSCEKEAGTRLRQ